MIKVGILGATGFTGIELVKILLGHPQVKIVFASSETFTGKKISEVYPFLGQKGEIILESFTDSEPAIDELAKKVDLIFAAYPHGKAINWVPKFLAKGIKVIDLSADFRLKDAGVYQKWYGVRPAPEEILKEAVYGLPEINREKIKKANLVANPGCYPTATLLALLPLLKENLIDPGNIFIDAKSSVSGAGRTPKETNTFAFCNENFLAYSVEGHRHQPEIEQELSGFAGQSIKVVFLTHLVPMNRGIFVSVYGNLVKSITRADLKVLYQKYYAREPFIRLLADGFWPATKNVAGSNFCDLAFQITPDNKKIIVLAAIDNLVKGAAGQAVQNLNLMFGLEETLTLDRLPLFP